MARKGQRVSKKRILIIEASLTFAGILLEFLKEQGYETERAENGIEGIKKLYSFLPELIITDAETPLLPGYQFTRLLKSRPATRNIPLIMYTVLEESKGEFWGKQAGADSYLEKSPENLELLSKEIERLLNESVPTDFELLKKEGKKINDNSIIEMINNLLDHKLFQTTVSGLLAQLSNKISSLEETVEGVFSLLRNVCRAEICSMMIKDSDGGLLVYNANHSGYNSEITEDFKAISIADFNSRFSDYKVVSNEVKDFFPAGEKNEKIESYMMLTLSSSADDYASVHIGTSVKEYFSHVVLENLNAFLASASPIIANALHLRQMETMQKKTRSAFARYVPVDVMDEIIKKSLAQSTQGETRLVAVLFSDIRSFTTISENTQAQELVDFLNYYFSKMGDEIIDEGGNIDKFIGDAIMAIFGAPKTLENAAVNAVSAAIRMIKACSRLDTSSITLPKAGFGIGVGVNFGECVVGNIGFQNKQDYTVIGDAVNLASRLEGITKYYHHPIIVSEFVYAAVKDHFILRKADNIRVKGKDVPVGIYAVYDAWQDEADEGTPPSLVIEKTALDQYNKGLKLFYMREFETAKQYFSSALAIIERRGKTDYLSSLYLERIAEYQLNPPPPDWDGTTTMTEK